MAYTVGLLRLHVTWQGYLDNLDLRERERERERESQYFIKRT